MADNALTPRQAEILNWLRRQIALRGAPPTRAELATAFGFASPNAAESHLRALVRKGVISLAEGTARGIRLLEEKGVRAPFRDDPAFTGSLQKRGSDPLFLLPLVGRVAAGQPVLAAEHIEQQVTIEPGLFRPRADYLLRVHGQSMRDVGILDGDWLAVHRASEAPQRAIVVARIEDEVTVKRYERRGQHVRLLAENPDFAPIEVDLSRTAFALEGIAVGVIRRGFDA